MSRLQMFNFEKQKVRVISKDNEPWFVAKDICEVLEISKYRDAVSRLDADETGSVVVDTLGGKQTMAAVNESGLYELIFKSRKPEAKQFKRWVTHEVIPSIRKYGAYMTPDTLEQAIANPDFAIGLLTNLKEEREKRQAAELRLEEQRPKVLFADSVEASQSSILIRELAILLKQNGINTGEKRLFEWLRTNGYLVKRFGTDRNMPTQRSMDLGLFEVKETPINHNSGLISINKTTKVTGKGQVYFINKFLSTQQVI